MAVNRWLGYRRTPAELMPEGWQLKRLRELATFAPGGSLGLTMSDYRGEGFDAYSAEGQNGKVAVAEFDGPAVVVSSIGSLCGKSFLAEGKFTTLANVQVVFPKQGEVDPYFLWNLLNAEAFWPRAQTGQPFIRPSDIKKAWIPLPLPLEQSCMAELFRSVDFLLAKVQAELVAARRLKTALMQQLFTRGIPWRHTRFKQTKIGLIPEEWGVITLGSIADIDAGVALNPDREPRRNVCRYLTVVNVQRERIDLSEIRHLELWDSEIPGKLLREGDIVAVEGHANSSEIGRAAMVTAEADGMAYQNHLFRIRLLPDVDFNSNFLLGCLNSERVRRHWNATANTSSGLNTINRRGLRKLRIPQPQRGEQDDIVALIAAANSGIRVVEDELLAVRRLKTSLLQNLLTGKVRIKMES
jgi:type I restriction enzyme S subunit